MKLDMWNKRISLLLVICTAYFEISPAAESKPPSITISSHGETASVRWIKRPYEPDVFFKKYNELKTFCPKWNVLYKKHPDIWVAWGEMEGNLFYYVNRFGKGSGYFCTSDNRCADHLSRGNQLIRFL